MGPWDPEEALPRTLWSQGFSGSGAQRFQGPGVWGNQGLASPREQGPGRPPGTFRTVIFTFSSQPPHSHLRLQCDEPDPPSKD